MAQFLHQLWIARFVLAQGVLDTLAVSAAAILIGTALGLIVGLLLTYGHVTVRVLCRIYVDAMRGTPVLVLILAVFYISPALGVQLDAFLSGLVALSLFCGAHLGEIVRGSVQTIPPGQTEAGRSIGLTFPQILTHVILPQVVRRTLPPWVNTAVELVKASTLLSVIGVGELLLKTQEIVARNFMTLDFYVWAGVVYLAINSGVEMLGKSVERRVRS